MLRTFINEAAAIFLTIKEVIGAVVPIFAEHWGDNLQFYPNFALFSTLGGMNSTTISLRCGNLVKTKKKMQTEHFFSPNSGEDKKKVFSKN